MKIVKLSDSLAVSPQIQIDDVAQIAAAGYQVLINNRPDGEESGQPSAQEIAAEAERVGLEYLHLPVTASDFPGSGFGQMQRLLRDDRSVLAFCRTGTRCANLWVASHSDSDAASVTAQGLGFDLSLASRYSQT